MPHLSLQKILAFAAVIEMVTGLVLMVDPVIVPKLLLGVDISGAAILLGRCFGITLLALGLACWPTRRSDESGSPAFLGMLIYNVLIALYLGYLGAFRQMGGLLLWPGVVLHAVMALLLIGSVRRVINQDDWQ
jgi:hypothetical protein